MVIWGGNRKKLLLENIDSHASVSAYFLTKYLSRYYNIVNLLDMDDPEQLLDHLDADIMLSTFQYGLTSRIVQKGKKELFLKIREKCGGKLCSIVDRVSYKTYFEDILFTVLPAPPRVMGNIIAKKCFNQGIQFHRMGWCADGGECYPETIPEKTINVFVDHPAYSPRDDCTHQYYLAFCRIMKKHPISFINAYHQSNQGIVKWKPDETYNYQSYLRNNKVPWKKIIDYYRRCQIFCVTHPESAGLAVIEAAMSGAKIYIPVHKVLAPFVSKELIKDGINYRTFRYFNFNRLGSRRIIKAFQKDMKQGFNRKRLHEKLSKTNSWEVAARRIHHIISTN